MYIVAPVIWSPDGPHEPEILEEQQGAVHYCTDLDAGFGCQRGRGQVGDVGDAVGVAGVHVERQGDVVSVAEVVTVLAARSFRQVLGESCAPFGGGEHWTFDVAEPALIAVSSTPTIFKGDLVSAPESEVQDSPSHGSSVGECT